MASTEMAGLELTAASARALVQAGRLRELIGVAPDASPEEVKAASKRALLKYHPDKGGDAELFKIIQPAVEELQLDGNQYAFEGGIIPPWAKTQLDNIAQTRREIQECGERLQAAQAREETARTGDARAKARVDIARQQRGIANLNEALALDLHHFGSCYTVHFENEQTRKEAEAQEAAVREVQRRQEARADLALQRRRARGMSKRFPTLPKANMNNEAIATLKILRHKYRSVRHASLKCKGQGRDATELESRAAEFMQQAREHVRHWCGIAHEEAGDRSKRFPQVPSNDPRHAEMAILRREYTKLKDCLRKTKSEHMASFQARVDDAIGRAVSLLGRTH
jgi:hypothetical protein